MGSINARSLNNMHLLLRSQCSTRVVEVSSQDSVEHLKNTVENVLSIPSEQQRLSYHGVSFEDGVLGELGLIDMSYVDVNCDLLGGAKKRKKKVYTTPKKIKHKRKKVKLATLKYYKVDSNGKITRLRRECDNEACGAGIFMASHFDRLYCGKCAKTYTQAPK